MEKPLYKLGDIVGSVDGQWNGGEIIHIVRVITFEYHVMSRGEGSVGTYTEIDIKKDDI